MDISIYTILGCNWKQTLLEKVIGVLITINAKCNIFLLNNRVKLSHIFELRIVLFVRNHFYRLN